MATRQSRNVDNVSYSDLERMIRMAVRQEVQAEFARMLHTPSPVVLEYWLHEGPEDEEGDAELLTEALEMLASNEEGGVQWKSLEDFEAELAQE